MSEPGRKIGGRESFQGHPERNTLGKLQRQTLVERLTLEPAVRLRFCGSGVGNGQSLSEDLIMRQNLDLDSPLFRRLRINGLAAPQQPRRDREKWACLDGDSPSINGNGRSVDKVRLIAGKVHHSGCNLRSLGNPPGGKGSR
jgi:hypothetical protein